MRTLVLASNGAQQIPVIVPDDTDTLVASQVIGIAVEFGDNGAGGPVGIFEARATLTSSKETFSAYLSGTLKPADGFITQLGLKQIVPFPVTAGETLMVVTEDTATVHLIFDQLG